MSPSGEQTESSEPRKPRDVADGASPGQTPLERLLDVGLYAPLGLLTTKGDVVRDLAAEGRKQVAFSRSLGRAALKAVAAGSRSGKTDPTSPATRPAATSAPTSPATRPAATSAPTTSSPAIADYDSLTAREVIALIPACTAEQREWIEATERAGKSRVTVLRALPSDPSNR